MLHVLLAIVHKELLDGVRDRRAVLSAFSFPLFAPLLIAFMLNSLATRTDDPLELAIIGGENAPELVGFLENQGIELQEIPDDPELAIADGVLDVVLVIPEDYGEDFREGRPASVQIMVDNSQDTARSGITKTRALLRAYSGHIGALRLLARGVDPGLMSPITIDEIDQSNPQKKAANLLDMIIMFVVLGAFVCSMYIAIEAAAGERERKSLEPLLINPVSRTVLVVGKWLAAVAFGFVGVVLTLVVMMVAIRAIPLESLGFRIMLSVEVGFWIFLIAAPLAPLAGALQLLIASFTRSFKEAQLYISLSLTLPMMPGLIMSLKPVKTEAWMYVVPLLSQQVLGAKLLRGEQIAALDYILAASSTLALTGVCLWATVWLFSRERMLFSKG
ncbi:MAG: sodium transport system permease protein [Myxococcota bacterium]|jgi:sodium transport system permease protein